MIAKGANSPLDWNGALMGASRGGHIDIVQLLISKGADDWNLALRTASNGGHKELMQFFENKLQNV